MSKLDKKYSNNSYGLSDSDTETELKQKQNLKKTGENKLKLDFSSSDDDKKMSKKQQHLHNDDDDNGRRSRTDKLKTKPKSNLYSDNEDDEKNIKAKSSNKSDNSRSRTPSSERYQSNNKFYNKSYDSTQTKPKKINHFSRPVSRQEKGSSSDESDKTGSKKETKSRTQDRTSSRSTSPSFSEKPKNIKKSDKNNNQSSKIIVKANISFNKSNSDSDSDSISNKKNNKKDGNQSTSSFERPKSSKISEKKKKPILRSSSSESTSDSETRSKTKTDLSSDSSPRQNKYFDEKFDDDAHSSLSSSAPIKVNIERKPPIDKTSLNKKSSLRSPSLERPHNDSNSDSDRSNRKNKSKNLNETFQVDSDNSSNEMTDVSPLPTPGRHNNKNKSKKNNDEKDLDRINGALLYKNLDSVLKNYNGKMANSRPNSVNFNDLNIKNTSSHYRTNDLNSCIDFSNSFYGSKLLRLDAENKRLYEKILKESTKPVNKTYDRPIRITSSAVNRQREQQRIEKENQIILKRLLDVKSSKYLRKDDQLKDYERNFGLTSLNNSRLTSGSNSCISTKRSAKSTANNSRVSSAKSRSNFNLGNLDAEEILKRAASLSRQRPEWNDRW